MQHKTQICFHESDLLAPRQCEKNLTCNSKRSGWKKFILEPLVGPLDLGTFRWADDNGDSGERTRPACRFGSSRVRLKVRDRVDAIASTRGRVRSPESRHYPAEIVRRAFTADATAA